MNSFSRSRGTCTQPDNDKSACTKALLRSLQFSGVKFLRYLTIDLCNNIRCKVKPIDHLLLSRNSLVSLEYQVSVAEVCYGGLPYYADVMIDGTGLTAQNSLIIQPDLNTFRNLPYAPKSAVVIGNLIDNNNNNNNKEASALSPSPLCARSLLRKVIKEAEEKYNIAFSVGVELEFCLVDTKTGSFVDESVFANTTTLNDQEEFLADLYDQLQQQYIPIELIHSESGPGQLEVVLQYSADPVELADNVLLAQETIRAVAAKKKYGYKSLFLPKYDMLKAGNGLHVHMSIRNATTGEPLMNGCDSSCLSPQGSAFVEGLVSHLPGLLGLTLPTVNSFRRVAPGCWTGSKVGWGLEDKEAGIRVCRDLQTMEWNHVEYKLCDTTCNLYLALAGLFTSGLQGVSEVWSLRPSLEQDLEAIALPGSIYDALTALKDDELLMNMMGSRMSQAYLALRKHEVDRNLSSNTTIEEEVKEALARS